MLIQPLGNDIHILLLKGEDSITCEVYASFPIKDYKELLLPLVRIESVLSLERPLLLTIFTRLLVKVVNHVDLNVQASFTRNICVGLLVLVDL